MNYVLLVSLMGDDWTLTGGDWRRTERNWATTTTGELGGRFRYRKCSVDEVFVVSKMVYSGSRKTEAESGIK